METPTNRIIELYERGEAYGRTTTTLAKLKGIEKGTVLAANFITKLAVSAVFLLFVLILNIAIALWLGELLGKSYLGFFAVAGFYFLVGCLMQYLFFDRIKKTLSDIIITQALQ